MPVTKIIKCKTCKAECSEVEMVDQSFQFNPRAQNCWRCVNTRLQKLLADVNQAKKDSLDNQITFLYLLVQERPNDYLEKLPFAIFQIFYEVAEAPCLYCGKVFEEYLDFELKKHVRIVHHGDHMDPLHLGGSNDARNFALACGDCNLRKGSMPFSDWVERCPEEFRVGILSHYKRMHGQPHSQFILGPKKLRSQNKSHEIHLKIEDKISSYCGGLIVMSDLREPVLIKRPIEMVPKDFNIYDHFSDFLPHKEKYSA